MVSSNRGILHIHDAFDIDGSLTEDAYKPLLMLLGSGRISLQSTQASLDNTVIMTTNLEEMNVLEKRLSALKLLAKARGKGHHHHNKELYDAHVVPRAG